MGVPGLYRRASGTASDPAKSLRPEAARRPPRDPSSYDDFTKVNPF